MSETLFTPDSGLLVNNRRDSTGRLFDRLRRADVSVSGGVVSTDGTLPSQLEPYRHDAVGLAQWAWMCSRSRISVFERGLLGSLSFKPLNYLMLGSPFIANEIKSNLWKPLEPEKHYFVADEDFENLEDLLERLRDDQLVAMGRRNRQHWAEYVCPTATCRYIIAEGRKRL